VLAKAGADGLIEHVCLNRSVEKTWFLTAAGREAVADINPNPLKMTAAKATGPTAAHLGLVNTIGVTATSLLGADAEVTWTHEEPLPLGSGRYLRPDAVLSLLIQQRSELVGGQWFIEADRGTEAIGILVDKLANYVTYHQYRPTTPGVRTPAEQHWRMRFRTWPHILFVFDCERTQSRIERLAAWAGSDPRLQKHWNTLSVSAIAATNLDNLTSPTALLQIPTLEHHPLIDSDSDL